MARSMAKSNVKAKSAARAIAAVAPPPGQDLSFELDEDEDDEAAGGGRKSVRAKESPAKASKKRKAPPSKPGSDERRRQRRVQLSPTQCSLRWGVRFERKGGGEVGQTEA